MSAKSQIESARSDLFGEFKAKDLIVDFYCSGLALM